MTLYCWAHVISLNIYLNTFLRYTLWSARVQNIWPDGPKMGAVKNRSCTKELKSDISCHTSQRSARCLAIRTTCVCNCTTAQLHIRTTVQLHNCTTAQLHIRTTCVCSAGKLELWGSVPSDTGLQLFKHLLSIVYDGVDLHDAQSFT